MDIILFCINYLLIDNHHFKFMFELKIIKNIVFKAFSKTYFEKYWPKSSLKLFKWM